MTDIRQDETRGGRRYKSHTELGLTQEQFCALVKTREKLADGTLKHIYDLAPGERRKKGVFNMATWLDREHSCGTVGCIGGWSEALSGHNRGELWGRSGFDSAPVVHDLFFPPSRELWANITNAQACKAIDNFLTTGKPEWDRVRKG